MTTDNMHTAMLDNARSIAFGANAALGQGRANVERLKFAPGSELAEHVAVANEALVKARAEMEPVTKALINMTPGEFAQLQATVS